MVRTIFTALLICSLLALTPAPSHAASFDPELRWRTLETPHFNITFHQGEAALAEEMAVIAEAVWDKMTAEVKTALPSLNPPALTCHQVRFAGDGSRYRAPPRETKPPSRDPPRAGAGRV